MKSMLIIIISSIIMITGCSGGEVKDNCSSEYIYSEEYDNNSEKQVSINAEEKIKKYLKEMYPDYYDDIILINEDVETSEEAITFNCVQSGHEDMFLGMMMYDSNNDEVIDYLKYYDYRFIPKNERKKAFDMGVEYAQGIENISNDEDDKSVEFYSMSDYLIDDVIPTYESDGKLFPYDCFVEGFYTKAYKDGIGYDVPFIESESDCYSEIIRVIGSIYTNRKDDSIYDPMLSAKCAALNKSCLGNHEINQNCNRDPMVSKLIDEGSITAEYIEESDEGVDLYNIVDSEGNCLYRVFVNHDMKNVMANRNFK